MIRLFAALALPDDVAGVLATRQHGIDGARWRPREALHVTLRFFGGIPEDVARDLDEELARIAMAPFGIALEGAGCFGEGDDLHAVWAGVAQSDPLRRLAKACEAAARRVGLPADPRRYRPHVTLAYLRRADPAEAADWVVANTLLKSPPIAVERFGLYSSILGRTGSAYRLEADYPLTPSPRDP